MSSLPPIIPTVIRTKECPSPARLAVANADNLILGGGDGISFEDIMKERNRLRKEREELNVAELKVQIGRLEDALAAETKRRVDATTKLDDMAREQVFEMETRLRSQLEEDNEKLAQKVVKLERRVSELEQKWEQESKQQLDTISNKSKGFHEAMDNLQEEQVAERKARLKREGRMLQQIESHAKEFEDRWEAERKDRMEQIQKLEERVITQEAKRNAEQANFRKQVEEELELLRQELTEEVQEREKEDEEIVSALNRYAQQLQHSLSILSAD